MSVETLPLELLNLILDRVDDRNKSPRSRSTVASLRMVSKFWNQLATPFFFRSITLDADHSTQFVALLSRSPSIADLIRDLRMAFHHATPYSTVITLGRNARKSWMPLVFPALSGKLGNVQNLHIEHFDGNRCDPDTMQHLLENYLNVAKLSLAECRFISAEQMDTIISSFPALRCLTLDSVLFDGGSGGFAEPLSGNAISLSHLAIDTHETILKWVLARVCLASTTEMRLVIEDDRTSDAAAVLLRQVVDSTCILQTLTLELTQSTRRQKLELDVSRLAHLRIIHLILGLYNINPAVLLGLLSAPVHGWSPSRPELKVEFLHTSWQPTMFMMSMLTQDNALVSDKGCHFDSVVVVADMAEENADTWRAFMPKCDALGILSFQNP